MAYVVNTVGGFSAYGQAATSAGTISIPVEATSSTGALTVGKFSLHLALAFLTASIAFRAVATERPPLGNLWEYTIALGWGILLFTALFEAAYKERNLGTVMIPASVSLMAVALLFFPSEVSPLVPALQSNRILGIHVTTMILSYSALSISFGAAVLYLIQGGGTVRRFERLPDSETLEEIGYWSVAVGLPLLALGIALGAYWANSAWGRYWGWDPKETAALFTFLIYSAYMHARSLRGWEGKRSAYLLIAGFGAVMFTYFAVNFVFSGLHSYAGV